MIITSRTHAGDFLHYSKPVYRVASVLAVPLEAKAARDTLTEESLRQARVPLPSDNSDVSSSSEEDEDEEEEGDDVLTPAAIPRGEAESQPGSSGVDAAAASAQGVGASATLRANKSGPWLLRNMRKNRSASEGGAGGTALLEAEEVEPVDPPSPMSAAMGASFEPAALTTSLVELDSKHPLSADERYHEASKAELEEKVVRETTRQYSRGEMCFAYDFDITTPLQRKEEARPAGAAPVKAKTPTSVPWEEPDASLPLWRRVDRRFWHNEYLCKDFIDAKVSVCWGWQVFAKLILCN